MVDTWIRNFCFTLNNYSAADIDLFLSFEHMQYVVIAKEIAPETGTPHLQGYMELATQQRFSSLKKAFPRVHLRERMGNQLQAIAYIKDPESNPKWNKKNPRPEDLYETGIKKSQGSQESVLDIAREIIRERKSIDPMKHSIGVIKCYEKLQKYSPPVRRDNDQLTRVWIYGPGGSGKTSRAYEMAAGSRIYKCDQFDRGWFDGYDGHDTIILDDFEPQVENKTQFKLLMMLLDRYPMRVEVKGSVVNCDPSLVVITSQLPPWHYYGVPGDDRVWLEESRGECKTLFDYCLENEQLRQLMRRIDLVISLDKPREDIRMPVIEKNGKEIPKEIVGVTTLKG